MTAAENPEGAAEAAHRPQGRPYRNVGNARAVSMLGVGMVIGAVIGAGVAILVAPDSGSGTRRKISRRMRKLRGDPGVWTKLGRQLRRAAAAKRKAMAVEAKRKEIVARTASIETPG